MTLTEIIERDIAYENSRRERGGQTENAARTMAAAERGRAWAVIAVWAAVLLAALGVAFAGGMRYQSHRDLRASRESAAWNERAEREATEAARAMGNHELLEATARTREAADRQNKNNRKGEQQ